MFSPITQKNIFSPITPQVYNNIRQSYLLNKIVGPHSNLFTVMFVDLTINCTKMFFMIALSSYIIFYLVKIDDLYKIRVKQQEKAQKAVKKVIENLEKLQFKVKTALNKLSEEQNQHSLSIKAVEKLVQKITSRGLVNNELQECYLSTKQEINETLARKKQEYDDKKREDDYIQKVINHLTTLKVSLDATNTLQTFKYLSVIDVFPLILFWLQNLLGKKNSAQLKQVEEKK